MEEWKTIIGTKNYEVSNKGRVRNIITGTVLKLSIDRYGYQKITIFKNDGTPYYATAHRLVAIAWIPNDNVFKNQVNHIDGNKLNNCVENLEWVTVGENINHAYQFYINKNTSHVKLSNIENGDVLYFKSIKLLGKHLQIQPGYLLPFIKNSKNNPIMGKYIVEVIHENDMFARANTAVFGKKVFIYDLINKEMKEYPSANLAAYFTGIRSIHSIDLYGGVIYSAGYYASHDPINIPRDINKSKEELCKERGLYLMVPYKRHDPEYYLYDYYKKQEITFSNYDEILNFLEDQPPFDLVFSKRQVQTFKIIKRGKNSLIKGFGIKCSFVDCKWYPYNEENIICSKRGVLPKAVYRVSHENKEMDLIGIYEVCKYFQYWPDKLIHNVSLDEVLKSVNIPNLSVIRLNKPIP